MILRYDISPWSAKWRLRVFCLFVSSGDVTKNKYKIKNGREHSCIVLNNCGREVMFAVAVIENSLWLLLHEEQFKSGIRHIMLKNRRRQNNLKNKMWKSHVTWKKLKTKIIILFFMWNQKKKLVNIVANIMLTNRRRNKQNNQKNKMWKSHLGKSWKRKLLSFFYVKSEEKAHKYCGKYNVKELQLTKNRPITVT